MRGAGGEGRPPDTSYGLQKRTSIIYTFSRNGVQHMWPSSDEFVALFANRLAENDVNSLYVLQKRKRRPPVAIVVARPCLHACVR